MEQIKDLTVNDVIKRIEEELKNSEIAINKFTDPMIIMSIDKSINQGKDFISLLKRIK